MRTTTVAATADIYECGETNLLVRTRLPHDRFRAYSLALKRLIHGLGEAASEEVWKPILISLRRYGFALCAAPLPFNEPTIQPAGSEKLHSLPDTLAMVYPAQAKQLGNTILYLEALIQSNENPYGAWLAEAALRNRGDGAVLIRDSRLIVPVERHLSRQLATRRLSVIAPAQLTKDRCFDVLYILGAARWFPDFVFDAPRSKRTELVRYAWIKDGRAPSKTFLNATELHVQLDDEFPMHEDYYEAADLLPVVDWRSIGQKIAAAELQNTLEPIDARLLLLEGDCAVFLEAAEGVSALILDLEADESAERIARITINRIRPGTFILLRTDGDGDYIVAEADRYFLQDRAPAVREAQQRWKEILRREVQKDGLLGVSLRLIDLGSSSAEESNVRNYLSARSIRTHLPEDFQAIMRLVGLGEEWKSYWDLMGEIDRAHRRAGHHIRRQLLHKLEELDLTELERIGRMDIVLPKMNAGGFTAYRILDVSPDLQLVNPNRLGHPFEL